MKPARSSEPSFFFRVSLTASAFISDMVRGGRLIPASSKASLL